MLVAFSGPFPDGGLLSEHMTVSLLVHSAMTYVQATSCTMQAIAKYESHIFASGNSFRGKHVARSLIDFLRERTKDYFADWMILLPGF